MPAFFPVSDVDVGDFDKALSAKPAPEALAARFLRPRHAVLAAQPGPDVALAAEGSFEYPESLEHGKKCTINNPKISKSRLLNCQGVRCWFRLGQANIARLCSLKET